MKYKEQREQKQAGKAFSAQCRSNICKRKGRKETWVGITTLKETLSKPNSELQAKKCLLHESNVGQQQLAPRTLTILNYCLELSRESQGERVLCSNTLTDLKGSADNYNPCCRSSLKKAPEWYNMLFPIYVTHSPKPLRITPHGFI